MNKKKITVPKLKTASFVGHNQQQLSAHIIGIAFVLIVGLKRWIMNVLLEMFIMCCLMAIYYSAFNGYNIKT